MEQYVRRLALKVVGEPEKKQLPGYRSEAYTIPIGTLKPGKVYNCLPLPTYRAEGYETVTMEGKKVRVVALKGSAGDAQEQGSGNCLGHSRCPS